LQKCNNVDWLGSWSCSTIAFQLETLPPDTQARFRRIAELIQGYGLERVHEPHVKHLEGPLWEMRMKGKDGISRAVYISAKGRRVRCPSVRQEDAEDAPARN
jgi:phage-related protein